jgi:hypothetical protein
LSDAYQKAHAGVPGSAHVPTGHQVQACCYFLENRMDENFAFFREIEMEKMGIEPGIARMGSVAWCKGKNVEASK